MSIHLLSIIRMEWEGVEKAGVEGIKGRCFGKRRRVRFIGADPGSAWRRVQRQVREPRSYSLFLRWTTLVLLIWIVLVLLIWINEFDAGVIARVEPFL